jgi:hypothetical protein
LNATTNYETSGRGPFAVALSIQAVALQRDGLSLWSFRP